jgi:hypothetical protein
MNVIVATFLRTIHGGPGHFWRGMWLHVCECFLQICSVFVINAGYCIVILYALLCCVCQSINISTFSERFVDTCIDLLQIIKHLKVNRVRVLPSDHVTNLKHFIHNSPIIMREDPKLSIKDFVM